MGIWTEGTDLPLASCAVMLRPTKAWNLYVQMAGRVLRSLTGILDPWQKGTNTDRKNAIAASSKPDALILDLVDITKNNGELCAVPSLVDLPANLDLEEQSLEKVKELLDEFAEVKDKVIGQCPIRFSELKAKLEQVNLMLRSEAKTVRDWKVTDRGYKFTHTPPGYSVELTEEPGGWKLQVKSPQGILYDKIGHPRNEFSEYLDRAVLVATEVVERAQAEKPKVDRGTLQRLSKAQIWHLQRKGHSCEEIAYMPMAKAKALLARYVPEYQAQKASQVSIEKITTETDI
jgi:hypothetical protein